MAAGATYEPLATTTLGSAQSSVTFSSISGSYTDLVLVFSVKANTAALNSGVRFNSDTGSNYSNTTLEANGSSVGSQRHTNVDFIRTDAYSNPTTSTFSFKIVHINNYSNSTTYKTALVRSGDSSTGVDAVVGLWRNTAAITSVNIYARNDSFASGSIFTLYGIKSA